MKSGNFLVPSALLLFAAFAVAETVMPVCDGRIFHRGACRRGYLPFFGESVSALRIASAALIAAGIVGLKLATKWREGNSS